MLRQKRRELRAVLPAVVLNLTLNAAAAATTLDDLKGYSIEIVGTVNNVWKTTDPRSNDVQFHRRIYIGETGRIFDYSDAAAGGFAEHQGTAAALNSATSLTRQRLMAWTIDGGNLTGISHEIEGVIVRTISVNAAHSACSISAAGHPDPATGRLVVMKFDGHTDELVSTTVRSATCAIKRGNIFAPDR